MCFVLDSVWCRFLGFLCCLLCVSWCVLQFLLIPEDHYCFSFFKTKIDRTPNSREATRVSREIERLERRREALLATWQFRYPTHYLVYGENGVTRERTLRLELALAAINGPQQPDYQPSPLPYQEGARRPYHHRNRSNHRPGPGTTDSSSIHPYRRHPRDPSSHWHRPAQGSEIRTASARQSPQDRPPTATIRPSGSVEQTVSVVSSTAIFEQIQSGLT